MRVDLWSGLLEVCVWDEGGVATKNAIQTQLQILWVMNGEQKCRNVGL